MKKITYRIIFFLKKFLFISQCIFPFFSNSIFYELLIDDKSSVCCKNIKFVHISDALSNIFVASNKNIEFCLNNIQTKMKRGKKNETEDRKR